MVNALKDEITSNTAKHQYSKRPTCMPPPKAAKRGSNRKEPNEQTTDTIPSNIQKFPAVRAATGLY